jgi:hypothetical protein
LDLLQSFWQVRLVRSCLSIFAAGLEYGSIYSLYALKPCYVNVEMGMRNWLAVTALAALLSPATVAAQSGVLEFHGAGVCNASAAVALNEGQIIVADDERPWLSTFDTSTQTLLGKTPVGFLEAAGEADIEGATILQGRVVWISSHGRDSKGRVQQGRQVLFGSHQLPTGATATERMAGPVRNLLPAIVAQARGDTIYDRLRASIGTGAKDKNLAPKIDGFNIEGLTTGEGLMPLPDAASLLIGLRNPVAADGRAILIELTNASTVLAGTATKLKLGRTILLDLGGRSIRDIAYSPHARAYLVIGGPVGDEAESFPNGSATFMVFKWDGNENTSPMAIESFGNLDKLESFHAEAIVPLPVREAGRLVPSDRVLLLSDDGKRDINGKRCEKLPASQQFFRGILGQVQ